MVNEIKQLLVDELSSPYCNDCKFGTGLEESKYEEIYGYWGCDDCHRKYMGWELSEEAAEGIAKKIMKMVKDTPIGDM